MRKNRPLIELPRLIDVSYDAIDNINDVISRLKLQGNFLVIGDQNTKKIAGDRVHDIISENNNSEFYQIEGATVENAKLLEKVYTQKTSTNADRRNTSRPTAQAAACAANYPVRHCHRPSLRTAHPAADDKASDTSHIADRDQTHPLRPAS